MRPRPQPRPAADGARRKGSVRIGVIASIAHRLPPTSYGPWEQVASNLAEGFVARGHEVTLFATADSATSAALGGGPGGYEEDAAASTRRSGRRCTTRPPSSGPTGSTSSRTISTSCR